MTKNNSGSKNPMYGKHHTESTKRKMRAAKALRPSKYSTICKYVGPRRDYSKILTKQFLSHEHVLLNKSTQQISKEIGCDRGTVVGWLSHHKIPLTKHKEGKNHPLWSGYKDIPKSVLCNIRGNANTRKLEFDLTLKFLWNLYVKQDKRCALSGRKINFVYGSKRKASLDRIDSTKGYTKLNVQWVHADINYAKQSLSNEEFISLCTDVANFQEK